MGETHRMGDRTRPLLQTSDGRVPRILLADDHALSREVSRLMMEASGCQVYTVGDGQAAIDAVRLSRFDAIIMDVRMPGLDGLEATRQIRAMGEPVSVTPIVALTADAMPKDVALCRAAGVDLHLPKPAGQAEIHDALLQVLGRNGLPLATPKTASG